MALTHPWWKKWLCYISCEWFSKPIFGKRMCVCLYDAVGVKKKVKRIQKGKDGGLRFFALPKTIALMGLDGSGKTSHSKNLAAFFDSQKIRYTMIHLPSVVPIKYLVKSKKGTKQSLGEKIKEPSLLIKLARQKLYILGIIWVYIFRFFPAWIMGRTVICDRWFYDELIHLKAINMSSFSRILSAVTPKPGLLFYMDVEAKDAHERTHEADLSFYEYKKRLYDTMARKKGAINITLAPTKPLTWKIMEKKLRNLYGRLFYF